MGYWYTSSLNAAVTVRKLKLESDEVRASCQMDASAGTIGLNVRPRRQKTEPDEVAL